MIRLRKLRQFWYKSIPQKLTAAIGKSKRAASSMAADQPQLHQIFSLCLGRDRIQVLRLDVLAPAEQTQHVYIPLTENQSPSPPSAIPADAETALAPLPAQERFRRFCRLYAGSIGCPRIEDRFYFSAVRYTFIKGAAAQGLWMLNTQQSIFCPSNAKSAVKSTAACWVSTHSKPRHRNSPGHNLRSAAQRNPPRPSGPGV